MKLGATLADIWDEVCIDAFGGWPEPRNAAEVATDTTVMFVAQRTFYRGALAMLQCLQRGASREALIDEALAACRAPEGTLL